MELRSIVDDGPDAPLVGLAVRPRSIGRTHERWAHLLIETLIRHEVVAANAWSCDARNAVACT